MFTTIIHPIRKVLLLSCNEYCVLDTVYLLSNNSKYGGWCIKSKDKIADDLDLSRQTVINAINALELKCLIDRDEERGYVKPSDFFRALMQNSSEWKLLSCTKNGEMASLISALHGVKDFDTIVQNLDGGVYNSLTPTCTEVVHKSNINSNKEIDINSNMGIIKKTVQAIPATIDDVEQYMLEQNIMNAKMNAEKFFNFYEAKGWMVGKNKIKSWKACVKTWGLPKSPVNLIKNESDKTANTW